MKSENFQDADATRTGAGKRYGTRKTKTIRVIRAFRVQCFYSFGFDRNSTCISFAPCCSKMTSSFSPGFSSGAGT